MSDVQMEGELEYLERAFVADAEYAIRGSVIRALIELITNSDDAYGPSDGPIRISLADSGESEFPVELRVADAARGLRGEELRSRLARLGVEKEDADAENARGLFGRGARDVASLGPITFAAIRDGYYSALRVEGKRYRFLAHDIPASSEHRSDLGLGPDENGFTNIVRLHKNVKVDGGSVLGRRLAANAQLRDLVGRRTVLLTDHRKKGFTARLMPPSVPPAVLETDVPVAGYEPVRLTLRRLPERASGAVTAESPHGLLIRSGISVFQNTWFHLEGRPEAAHFCGEIDAPQIARIIRAFDKKDPLGGSTRLLARDRDGLVREHEYTKALATAIATAVQSQFESLAKAMAAERRQGENLSKAFEVARKAIRDQMRQVLEEIEEDEAPTGSGEGPLEELAIIPPRRILAPGEQVTFTVRARTIAADDPITAAITAESTDGVIDGVAASSSAWSEHPRLDAMQTTVSVTAGTSLGTAVLRVTAGGHAAQADLIVEPPPVIPLEPPTELEFERDQVSVAPGRRRRLVIRAPLSFAEISVSVGHSGDGEISPVGSVTLAPEPGGRWVTSVIGFTADASPGSAVVTAWIGDVTATCRITIKEPTGPSGPDFDFELRGFKDPDRRATLLPESGRLKVDVFGLHPGFAGVFGPYRDDQKKFEREDEPEARAVLAEVIGVELASYLVEREYIRFPERLNDAARVLRRRSELQLRIQAILHRALRASVG